ncbi:MAG TPA: class I SAM-dependent methyltransferase [Acidimicrobiales bacterium]|nr:class I SAM-dependent methyltransferase [Acidimicrobiales bacterium]
MRRITHAIATNDSSWDAAMRAEVRKLFASLAPEWHTRTSVHRMEPVRDAVERGGVHGGTALELGSGTGLATAELATRFDTLIAMDLSPEMLELAPAQAASRVVADSSRLPVASSSVDAVLLINCVLFASEVARVLKPDGALVWVNTSGDRTPIYLDADHVLAAMSRTGMWAGVASEAGWGTWAVLRRD